MAEEENSLCGIEVGEVGIGSEHMPLEYDNRMGMVSTIKITLKRLRSLAEAKESKKGGLSKFEL